MIIVSRSTRVARAGVVLLAVGLTTAACSSATHSSPPTAAPSSAIASPSAEPSASQVTASSAAPTSTRTAPATTHKAPPTTSAQPGASTDPLTGLADSKNPVLAVKIDNTYFRVPQFGVSQADIVFVEQVEGGLTRLIGIFHSNLNVEVGPVRSVRSTDAELLPVFGRPGLVFSGGAGGPLADLHATKIIDTSDDTGYFRSEAATGTYNLHADLSQVRPQAVMSGATPAMPIGLTFAASDPALAADPTVHTLTVTMEEGVVNFQYAGGLYVRYRQGDPVKDYQGQTQDTDNVVVMHVKDEPDGTVDTNGQPSYRSDTVGSGVVTLYRDGRAVVGSWSRAAANDPFTFKTTAGTPLLFRPGKTWIILAPQSASVSQS